MKTTLLTKPSHAAGFSVLELVVTAAIIGVLALTTIISIGGMNSNVQSAKLTADVTKLNSMIKNYLATGGSLAGLTTAQQVLDKMKTTRTAADATQEVLPETGRFVDIRLAAQTSSAAASSSAPQAVYNATTQQFTVSTSSSTTGGVTQFYMNDALASNNYGTETRAQSAALYNSSPGWVWATTNTGTTARLTPMDATGLDYFTTFNPLPVGTGGSNSSTTSSSSSSSSTTSGSGGVAIGTTTTAGSTTATVTSTTGITIGVGVTGAGVGVNTTVIAINGNTITLSNPLPGTGTFVLTYAMPVTLPTPIINPKGGSFYQAFFPSLLSINPNGAASSVSDLQYNVNGTGWQTYYGPFPVSPQSTIQARNLTLNTAAYSTSGIDQEAYYVLVPLLAGTVTPTWTSPVGGSGLVDTIINTNPASVVFTHGAGSTSSVIPGTGSAEGNPTNWNATLQGDILWMSSVVRPSGTVTDGLVIYYTQASISFPFNGGTQTVTAPAAQITYSSAFTTGSTTYNSATNTWITQVPLSAAGNWVFLTGVPWQVPAPGITSNISGSQVVMGGNFSSSVAGTGVQWKWSAASYIPTTANVAAFNEDPNLLGVQTYTGNNGIGSYMPGTPLNNINPNTDSGGSGGGSGNYTGGYSGTQSFSSALVQLSTSTGTTTSGSSDTMTFVPANFNTTPNTGFSLGQMTVGNGNTSNNTAATAVTLHLVLALTAPFTGSYPVDVNYTINAPDGGASTDTITLSNPTTDWTIVQGGVVYTLALNWASLSDSTGWTRGSTLNVSAGQTATTQLIGTFVSTP